MRLKFLLKKSIIHHLSEDELTSFQKGLALPYFLLGFTFIVMGIIETKDLLPLPLFLTLYIILGAVSLLMMLNNNKKQSGYYFW